MNLAPPNNDKSLHPIVLFPNQGRGFGFGVTRPEGLPEGYDRTINMWTDGRVLSPMFEASSLSHVLRVLPLAFAVPWRTSAGDPFVIYASRIAPGTAIVYRIQNNAISSETDATAAAQAHGAALHDDGAGTAYLYMGTDLTTGFLNRRTQAGTWTEDADVRAKHIVEAAGAMWRTTSDYQ